MGTPAEPRTTSQDHAGLEAALARVIDALARGVDGAVELWREFEADLVSHLVWEERVVLAQLLVARPREATVILEEHRHLRRRLAQIDGEPAGITADVLRRLLDELTAHGRHEDRELYRWARSVGLVDASSDPRATRS